MHNLQGRFGETYFFGAFFLLNKKTYFCVEKRLKLYTIP